MNLGVAFWIWAAAALVSGIAVLGVLQAQGRKGARVAYWPSSAMWLLLAGLGWFCWQPLPKNEQPLTVFTLGTDPAMAELVVNELGKHVRIFALPEAAHLKDRFPNLVVIPDFAWLQRNEVGGGSRHILGWGVPVESLQELKDSSWIFHPSPLPIGFSHVHWPSPLVLGQSLRVNGLLGQKAQPGWSIQLRSPAGDIAATQKLKEGDLRFEVSTLPAASGPLTFSVAILDEEQNLLVEEQVPVYVEEPETLEVWAILGSPRFEFKFLRNWLGEAGTKIALRTHLTEAEWRDEAVNRSPLEKTLVRRDWSQPDVLILDYLALEKLNAGELSSIQHAVENGMGLLCLPEGLDTFRAKATKAFGNFFAPWELVWEEEGIDMLEAQLVWSGPVPAPAEKVSHLPAKLLLGPGQAPLVEDTFGTVLAGKAQRGEGLVGLSLIRDTQQLVMVGGSDGFAKYWSRVLSALARPKSPATILRVAFPLRVGEPAAWNATASAAGNVYLKNSPTIEQVYWESGSLQSGSFSGRFWVGESGWQVPVWGTKDLIPFFTYPADAWFLGTAQTRLSSMKNYLKDANLYSPLPPAPAWPWLWILILTFMALAAFVWLSEKLGRL